METEQATSEVEDLAVNETAVIDREPDLQQWEHSRIIIHRNTFKRIMAIGNKDAPEMLMLYCFYFEQARRQETNQPYANDWFCYNEKGLKWSKDRFYRIKKLLLEHGFIEQIIHRDDKGRKSKYYIKVNYMNKTNKLQCPEKADSGKKRIVGKTDTNALKTVSKMLKEQQRNGVIVLNSSRYGEIEYINKDNYTQEQLDTALLCLDANISYIGKPAGFIDSALKYGWKPKEADATIQQTKQNMNEIRKLQDERKLHPNRFIPPENIEDLIEGLSKEPSRAKERVLS